VFYEDQRDISGDDLKLEFKNFLEGLHQMPLGKRPCVEAFRASTSGSGGFRI
jgi:hypothetical protein